MVDIETLRDRVDELDERCAAGEPVDSDVQDAVGEFIALMDRLASRADVGACG